MQGRIRNVYIIRLVFEDMPVFSEPPPVRGFTLVSTGTAINSVANSIGARTASISPLALAGNLSGLVQLDEPSEPMVVPNGWQERKTSALIEVLIEYQNQRSVIYRFRCYTDRSDFMANGIPAPTLMLFINNIEEFTVSNTNHASGLIKSEQMYYSTTSGIRGAQLHTVKPADVLTDTHLYRYQAEDAINSEYDDHVHASAVSCLSNIPSTESTALTVGPNWLASILNSYISAREDQQKGIGSDVMSLAIDSLSLGQLQYNPFLEKLASLAKGITSSLGWISFRHICELDHTLSTDTQRVIYARNTRLSTESDSLNGVAIEQTIAQLTATHVRTWMYSSNLAAVSFTVTNLTIGGVVATQFNDAIVPLVPMLPEVRESMTLSFVRNIEGLLFPQLSQGGLFNLSVTVMATHSSSITIVVTIEGGYPRRYVFPAFMDNCYSPMVSSRSAEDVGRSADMLLRTLDLVQQRNIVSPQPALQIPSYNAGKVTNRPPVHNVPEPSFALRQNGGFDF